MGIHSGACMSCHQSQLVIQFVVQLFDEVYEFAQFHCGFITKLTLKVVCLYRCVSGNGCVPQLSRSSPAYVLPADLLEMVAILLPPADRSEHAHAVQARCCEPALPEDEATFAATGSAAEKRTGARDMRNHTPTTAGGADDLLAWVSAQDDSDTEYDD